MVLSRLSAERGALPSTDAGFRVSLLSVCPHCESFSDLFAEKTTIGGRIKHEISCTPVPNAETDHILQLRAIEAMKPKAQTTILGALPYGPDGIIYAGTQRAHDAFEGFIVRAIFGVAVALTWTNRAAENRAQA